MSLLPRDYLNAVVLIETTADGASFAPIASGFLAGFRTGEKGEAGEELYRVFLVTNRHVFHGKKEVVLRFNISEGGSKRYVLHLEDTNGPKWRKHEKEKADVAVIPINVKALESDHIAFWFFPEDNMAFKNTVNELGITQGDDIFVLGFPMGIAGEEKNYVIVRSGVIARLDDEIIDRHSEFLIDASVFPGNSGGPVVLKPSMVSIRGTKPVNKAYLLGVVKNYIPYKEDAVGLQTRQLRITFMENSGLAGVVPMDFVKGAVVPFMTTQQNTTG